MNGYPSLLLESVSTEDIFLTARHWQKPFGSGTTSIIFPFDFISMSNRLGYLIYSFYIGFAELMK